MQTYRCRCKARLFFHNSRCIQCSSVTAMCPGCRSVTALDAAGKDRLTCSNCQQAVRLCQNRTQYEVCIGAVTEDSEEQLCRYCRLNSTIPDLAVPGNLEKWRKIEFAKHRVLDGCDRVGLPVADDDAPVGTPLRFDFKSSLIEPVSTGHADGLITLDIEEADSVRREKTRIEFEEPQRTLVGHFRHELGHYYWKRIVEPNDLQRYRAIFGDETQPPYAEARDRYYASGPPENWQPQFISRYASMHSWEDFAETFNAYLDMIAIVATASHFEKFDVAVHPDDFDRLLAAYTEIGIAANELNRDMGLIDLVPEVFTPAVVEKLRFIHRVRTMGAQKSRDRELKKERAFHQPGPA